LAMSTNLLIGYIEFKLAIRKGIAKLPRVKVVFSADHMTLDQ
jgi:hypothetical protein